MKSTDSGILVIDKPTGCTSRDIVNIIGKTFHTKKIGHTGTLDPLATGVLVLCINRATKIAEILTNHDKEYIATFQMGLQTDTLDITGTILQKEEIKIDEEKLKEILNDMIGNQVQEVPIYSAVKVNGKKLYEYARAKEEITLPKHQITIYNLELLKIENETITLKCMVSKGTYIRALGEDIAKRLNTHATMTSLRRTKLGNFTIEKALPLEKIDENTNLIPLIEALSNYPKIIADNELIEKLKHGNLLPKTKEDIVLFVDENNTPLCLYKTYQGNKMKPWKMFF